MSGYNEEDKKQTKEKMKIKNKGEKDGRAKMCMHELTVVEMGRGLQSAALLSVVSIRVWGGMAM